MKRFIALALLLLLAGATSNVQAEHPKLQYQKLVMQAGCQGIVYKRADKHVFQSYFTVTPTGQPLIMIGVKYEDRIPESISLMVVFHETGHCLQYQDKSKFPDTKSMELDADRRSADTACRMGLDGRRLLHDLFAWAGKVLDYHGDEDHGTSTERISQGQLAHECDKINSVY